MMLCLCSDGILEYYWGEHIHLGYYSEEERARGYKKKDFKQAKLDFVDEMLAWSGARQPQRILDVGCGIGGTSRHLAATFPNAAVQGAPAPLCLRENQACGPLLWVLQSFLRQIPDVEWHILVLYHFWGIEHVGQGMTSAQLGHDVALLQGVTALVWRSCRHHAVAKAG